VFFFLSNSELVRFAVCPIISSFIFSVVSVILLFSLALYPQAIGLAQVMPNWAAWLVSVSLVLAESFFASFVFGLIAFRKVQDKIFMKTLELKGVRLRGNQNCCRDITFDSGHLIMDIMFFMITLPLNLFPVIGTVAFCLINGYFFGWELHQTYFNLKKMSFSEQRHHMSDNAWDYTTFGGTCIFLDLLPGFNFLLIFSNYVAAGLYAADMELGQVNFNTRNPQKWSHRENEVTFEQMDDKDNVELLAV